MCVSLSDFEQNGDISRENSVERSESFGRGSAGATGDKIGGSEVLLRLFGGTGGSPTKRTFFFVLKNNIFINKTNSSQTPKVKKKKKKSLL